MGLGHPVESASTLGALQIWIIGGVVVSFAEHSHFDRALSQKRPVILRSLLIAAIP